MSDIENKARVLVTPVQEFDRRTLDTLLRCITGRGLTQFVQDVFENRDGLYDSLYETSAKGGDSHET